MVSKKQISIGLENMEFYAYHGVYSEERVIGAKFLVSVKLLCDIFISGEDKLEDTYNYEWIYEITSDEMSRPKKLLETIAFHMATRLKEKSSCLISGSIKISKEGLAIGGKLERSFIEYPF